MEIAGYFSSIFIGLSLGLIGGGGSILTVPVLVYLFSIDTVLATAYSLFVVGATSALGSVSYFKKGLVTLRTAMIFGMPSIFAVFLTRRYVVPAIPHQVFSIGDFTVTKNILLMVLFAILMIVASYSMIRKTRLTALEEENAEPNYLMVFLQGLLVGFVTGLVGAGGGFLIIPVLVNGLKMPIKKAIGTSLLIIAVNSLFGFFTSVGSSTVDWGFLLRVTLIAMAGVFIGSGISTRIDGKKLKPAFGWFVLVMGVYILIKEICK